jgi:hypothetical protein
MVRLIDQKAFHTVFPILCFPQFIFCCLNCKCNFRSSTHPPPYSHTLLPSSQPPTNPFDNAQCLGSPCPCLSLRFIPKICIFSVRPLCSKGTRLYLGFGGRLGIAGDVWMCRGHTQPAPTNCRLGHCLSSKTETVVEH